jgi:arsenate reductase
MITIYHNPRCGKSRECLAFIENTNKPFETIKYLENPLSFEELSAIIHKLNIPAIELIRTKEPIWIKKYKGKDLSNEEILTAIVANPILMERPVVVIKDRAIIARPLSNIDSIL